MSPRGAVNTRCVHTHNGSSRCHQKRPVKGYMRTFSLSRLLVRVRMRTRRETGEKVPAVERVYHRVGTKFGISAAITRGFQMRFERASISPQNPPPTRRSAPSAFCCSLPPRASIFPFFDVVIYANSVALHAVRFPHIFPRSREYSPLSLSLSLFSPCPERSSNLSHLMFRSNESGSITSYTDTPSFRKGT